MSRLNTQNGHLMRQRPARCCVVSINHMYRHLENLDPTGRLQGREICENVLSASRYMGNGPKTRRAPTCRVNGASESQTDTRMEPNALRDMAFDGGRSLGRIGCDDHGAKAPMRLRVVTGIDHGSVTARHGPRWSLLPQHTDSMYSTTLCRGGAPRTR
jgi:hypothetical protein